MKSWHLPPALHLAAVCLIMLVVTRVYAGTFANIHTYSQATHLANALRGACIALAVGQLHLNMDRQLHRTRRFPPGFAALLTLDLLSGPLLTGRLSLDSLLLSFTITVAAGLTLYIRARRYWRRFAASLGGLEQLNR